MIMLTRMDVPLIYNYSVDLIWFLLLLIANNVNNEHFRERLHIAIE